MKNGEVFFILRVSILCLYHIARNTNSLYKILNTSEFPFPPFSSLSLVFVKYDDGNQYFEIFIDTERIKVNLERILLLG